LDLTNTETWEFKVHDETGAANAALQHPPMDAGVVGATRVSDTTSISTATVTAYLHKLHSIDWKANSRGLCG